MAEAIHRMTLAIPASLKPRLDKRAAEERRSLNKQIIVMLEAATADACEPLKTSAEGAAAAEQRCTA